jgi:hypothetical protein
MPRIEGRSRRAKEVFADSKQTGSTFTYYIGAKNFPSKERYLASSGWFGVERFGTGV